MNRLAVSTSRRHPRRRLLVLWALGTLVAGSVAPGVLAVQAVAPPALIFGTWQWDPTSRTSASDNYRCYVERLDDVGGGRVRVRDHRVRLLNGAETQVIRNDFDVIFNTPVMRSDGTSTLWRIVGPRAYQFMTLSAPGSPPTLTVTRVISADGRRMTQVAEGVVKGVTLRTEFAFDRATDGGAGSGDCRIE